jgi:hypothetical protein
MYTIFGESRLVLLVSLVRASVLIFMFFIVYVWLVDDSFPFYIIRNVIWVIENSLVNLYAGLCGWSWLYTSLMCLRYSRNMRSRKLWVCVGGRGKWLWHFRYLILSEHQEEYHEVQFCHPNLTQEPSLLLCDTRNILLYQQQFITENRTDQLGWNSNVSDLYLAVSR